MQSFNAGVGERYYVLFNVSSVTGVSQSYVMFTVSQYDSYGYLFYAYGMVLTNAFNGAGDTWTPTWLNLFCFWFWEIPLAWVLARHFNLGPQGVAWAVTIAFSTLAVASAVLFRRGRWKLKTV